MSLPPRDRPPPPGNLPIWATVAASYRSVFAENLNHLPNTAAGPFVLTLLVLYLSNRIGVDIMMFGGSPTTVGGWLRLILVSLVSFVPYVIFAVAWHRLILLGPGTAAPVVIPSMTTRHWRFYYYGLLLFLLGIVITVVIVGLPAILAVLIFRSDVLVGLVVLVALCPALAIGLRLSLVLPPTAIDKNYGLGDAFRLSEKQGFRMLATFIVIWIPFALGNAFFNAQVQELGGEIERFPTAAASEITSLYLWIAIYTVVNYLGMAVGVSFLSLSFMHMSGWKREGSGEQAPPPPLGDANFDST